MFSQLKLTHIYRCVNTINGKVYIGCTVDLARRKSAHKYEAITRRTDTKFYNAIRKYGFESFTWEIVYSSWDAEHCINIIEDVIIKYHDSINNGYNSMQGGYKGPSLFGADNGMYGKTHSDKFKREQSARAIDKFKGKSYEEIYGVEKAKELKAKRSANLQGIDQSGTKNSNHKDEILSVRHTSGDICTGARLHICEKILMPRPALSRLIKHYGSVGKRGQPYSWRGWILI